MKGPEGEDKSELEFDTIKKGKPFIKGGAVVKLISEEGVLNAVEEGEGAVREVTEEEVLIIKMENKCLSKNLMIILFIPERNCSPGFMKG